MNKQIKQLTIIALLATASLQAVDRGDMIKHLVVDKNMCEVTINDHLAQQYFTDSFRAHYGQNIDLEKLPYTIQTLPFLLNAVATVWISGDTYHIKQMDRDVYASLATIKEVCKRLYPRTQFEGELIADELVAPDYAAYQQDRTLDGYKAVCFTAGLDSTYSSLKHDNEKQLLVTVFQEVNSPSYSAGKLARIKQFATEHGHATHQITSNYQNFFNRSVLYNLTPDITHWRLEMVEGIGWVGLVAPLMIHYGLDTHYIAASLATTSPYHHGPLPLFEDNMRLGSCRFYHDGFTASRVEKCRFIDEYYAAHPRKTRGLKVCGRDHTTDNCSRCEKCMRTIFALAALGIDHMPYGFTGSLGQHLQRAQTFYLKQHYNHYCVWHYECIQQAARERIARSNDRHPLLEWLIAFDFNTANKEKDPGFYRMNWQDFADLLPDTWPLAALAP